MRYGVFSDVHGNLEALEVVLEFLKGKGVDGYLFLGDAVGYGANPNEVCDRLRPLVSHAVLGNHDAAVTSRMEYADYYEAARHALDWCSSQLSAENLEWLRSIPYQTRHGDIGLSHGAPVAPELFDYLFTAEQVADTLAGFDNLPPVTFIGHSHLTISFEITTEQVTPMMVPQVRLRQDARYIITVGSVGQPRDRDPRACCGIYDTDARTFTFNRLDYDKDTARLKIIKAGLAPVFGDRLLVGM
ncbi:MAG: metallophosphoesterase family protein [Deltaproteobacteria bacterium]|nr:metallophosphoesterase family protein [Deltaproteobacteria bacterium]